MKSPVALYLSGLFLLLIAPLFGADWPQFHGPTRDGIVPDSPPLLEEFPKNGLKKVWESEVIPDTEFRVHSFFPDSGELVVADGKIFAYIHNLLKPKFRIIMPASFKAEGYSPAIPKYPQYTRTWSTSFKAEGAMPPELSKRVEEARVSEARLKLKDGKEIDAWADAWVNANLTEGQARLRGAVARRLSNGSVLSWDVLAKLHANMNHVWDTEKEMQDWMSKEGIDEPSQKYIMAAPWLQFKFDGYTGGKGQTAQYIPAEDFIYCFDARNGKLLWRTEPMKGMAQTTGAHTTPAVLGKRCYVFNSSAQHYCFDVETGKELWHSESFGPDTPENSEHHHTRCSSVLLVDGVAIGLSQTTGGVDMETGKTLWCRKDLGCRETESSPALWRDGQKNWVIIHLARPDGYGSTVKSSRLICLDPKDGTTRWEWTDEWFRGTTGTPIIMGNTMVLATGQAGCTGGAETDLAAFKLTPEKPEVLWHIPLADPFTTPLIDHGCVYFLSGGNGNVTTPNKRGTVSCIELQSGKILWQDTEVFKFHTYTSPVLADGKIIALDSIGGLVIFKATPEKFTLIGRQDKLVSVNPFVTPTVVDGRIYLRMRNKRQITCYDLRKQ